jgi:hypothetical protein
MHVRACVCACVCVCVCVQAFTSEELRDLLRLMLTKDVCVRVDPPAAAADEEDDEGLPG